MKKALAGALFAACVATVGCAGASRQAREKNPAPCPNAIVLSDAARFIEFDGDADIDNVAYSGEIANITTVCRYFSDKPIDAEISFDIALGKGPRAQDDDKIVKYFVAVTRRDFEVIAKEEFAVQANFSGKKTVVVTREEIDKIVIPRADDQTSGTNFEIVVGFVLTPAQAIFNRSGESLRFPNIK